MSTAKYNYEHGTMQHHTYRQAYDTLMGFMLLIIVNYIAR